MVHLKRTLQKTNLKRHDIVVMTVRHTANDSEYALNEDQVFGVDEKELFSAVVTMAEKEGKTVELLVVPAADPIEAVVQTAASLKVGRLVTGVSPQMTSDELARRIGLAWENLPSPRHSFSLEIIPPNRPSTYVNLGPHPPRLWPEDVGRLHDLWLKLSSDDALGSKLHHRDVVRISAEASRERIDSRGAGGYYYAAPTRPKFSLKDRQGLLGRFAGRCDFGGGLR